MGFQYKTDRLDFAPGIVVPLYRFSHSFPLNIKYIYKSDIGVIITITILSEMDHYKQKTKSYQKSFVDIIQHGVDDVIRPKDQKSDINACGL